MAAEKLTKRVIDRLRAKGRPIRVYDTELKGFGLDLRQSGLVSYFIEYRPGGGGRRVSKKRMTLGRDGELTPSQARSIAQEMLAQVRHGHDPLADRQTKRREMRVFELIDQWEADDPVSRRTGQPMSRLTRRYTLARLRNHVVPTLGKKRLSDVQVADINEMIRQISNGETAKDGTSRSKRGRVEVRGGSGAARKVASDLSILFNYAIEKGIVQSNPVSHARKPRAGKRQDFLSADDVAQLGRAFAELEAEGCNPLGIAILRLLLLTGARPGEIERLKWSEVDFEQGYLRLAESKTGYSIRPLSRAAAKVLKSVPRTSSKFVFPATRGEGHFTNSKKIWNLARTRANLPDRVRYHARHGVATLALSEGVDPVSVAAVMGHAGPRTTLSTYAHVVNERAANAAETIGQKVASAMTGSPAISPCDHHGE